MAIAYLQNIKTSASTLWNGLKLTIKHFGQARHSSRPLGISDPEYFKQDKGIATLQYPHESIPVPDNGRYRLHNEIDDCIVCDKCAKVCPVDCIDIEPIRSPEVFGHTSDGTAKRIYAARFDIDMGKCCFCGLCTTVCPTECLTMTKAYDFSEYDVNDHNYQFATMTPLEILERKKEFEEYTNAKEERLQSAPASKSKTMKPKTSVQGVLADAESKAKPVFKPKMKVTPKKPVIKSEPEVPDVSSGTKPEGRTQPKPIFKPKVKVAPKKPIIKPKSEASNISSDAKTEGKAQPKPVFKPKVKGVPKPVIKPKPPKSDSEDGDK